MAGVHGKFLTKIQLIEQHVDKTLKAVPSFKRYQTLQNDQNSQRRGKIIHVHDFQSNFIR